MHHAPVGVVGHHQPRDGVQSPGVVERGGQDAADVGQQPGPARPRFGVAARPLLAGEELHVSQRDGGVVGQPHQDGLVALAERARAAVVDVDQALDALAHPDRCDHHRLAALGADHRRVVGMQAAIVEDVGGAHRAAGRQHLTAEALARLQQHVLVAADPGADRVAVRHALAAVVPQRDPREVGAAQVLGGRRHLLEHRVEVEGGVDGPRQLGQQLGLATPGFGLGVQARIVEGDGSVIGERLGQPHLVRRERAAQAVAEGEGADRPALEAQRQRQDRPVLGLLDPGARGLGEDDVRIGQHVVARHRPAPAHGGADHAGVARHDPADLERPHVARYRQADEIAGLRLDAVHGRRHRAQQTARQLGQPLGDGVDVEALGEDAAQLGDRLGLAPSGLLDSEQLRALVLGALALGDVRDHRHEAADRRAGDVRHVGGLQLPLGAVGIATARLERHRTPGQRSAQVRLDRRVPGRTDDLGHLAPDDGLRREAVPLGEGTVGEPVAAVGVDVVHHHRRGVRHETQVPRARLHPQPRLGPAGDQPGDDDRDRHEDGQPRELGRRHRPRVARGQDVVVERGGADGDRQQRRPEAADPGDDEDRGHERGRGHLVHERRHEQHQPEGEGRHDEGEEPARDREQRGGNPHAYRSRPSGPRSRLSSSGLSPKRAAMSRTVSSRRISATPIASVSSAVSVSASMRRMAWRSRSWRMNSTSVSTRRATERCTSSGSAFQRGASESA